MMSLVVATVIWMLIYKYLESNGMWEVEDPPRATPLSEEEIRALEEENP
ncbi:hypothetical protein HAHE_12100 [Haloferula helveola]|uniref:Uncharacterized protein n=1 Tax=Haloferula helveola TaxID=490095 RepID=A0ABN6H3X5_9BACT|nr:hypothetical protein HAHE_12100 [Haloferula helveola]